MCSPPHKGTLDVLREGVTAMIDWGSPNWGGNVHLASNGSWVADRHGDEIEDTGH